MNMFLQQFSREIHTAFCRNDGRLKGTVKQNSTKSILGMVPRFSMATIYLSEKEVKEKVDDWQALKTDIDQRLSIASKIANYFCDAADIAIIQALNSCNTQYCSKHYNQGMNSWKFLNAIEHFERNSIPLHGLFCAVGWQQWGELLNIDSFAQSPHCYPNGRQWGAVTVIPTNGLPKEGTSRKCFMYKKDGLGFGYGDKVGAKLTEFRHKPDVFNLTLDVGCEPIDDLSIMTIECEETHATISKRHAP